MILRFVMAFKSKSPAQVVTQSRRQSRKTSLKQLFLLSGLRWLRLSNLFHLPSTINFVIFMAAILNFEVVFVQLVKIRINTRIMSLKKMTN